MYFKQSIVSSDIWTMFWLSLTSIEFAAAILVNGVTIIRANLNNGNQGEMLYQDNIQKPPHLTIINIEYSIVSSSRVKVWNTLLQTLTENKTTVYS